MSININIPFPLLELQFAGNDLPYWQSLTYLDEIFPSDNPQSRLDQFQDFWKKEIIQKGDYLQMLDLIPRSTFLDGVLQVDFKAATDGISYPAFFLEFEYYYQEQEKGCYGLIPALQISLLARDEEELRLLLLEEAQHYFQRDNREELVQNFISTIWFETVDLVENGIKLQLPSLEQSIQRQKKELKWLPKVAQVLKPREAACYGHEKALTKAEQFLNDAKQRQLLIIGPRGIGKTSFIRALAFRRKKKKDKIWETTANRLLQQCMDSRGWEANLTELCQELKDSGHFLFIRDFANLFQVGKAMGLPITIGDFLRPYLSRNDFGFIAEARPEDIARIELQHPSYLNYLEQIELSIERTKIAEVVGQKANQLGKARMVSILAPATSESIEILRRFAPYAGMPGDAIQLLNRLLDKGDTDRQDIGRQEVINFFCEQSGMPRAIVDPSYPLEELELRGFFENRLFGQNLAIDRVSEMLLRLKARLTREGRPTASFLFVGPTGTGKTELARLLATYLFGSSDRMIRFDMSEYSSPEAVLQLIEDRRQGRAGTLLRHVRKQPFCVLLFDEIEKAHTSFRDLLLQVLDEGRLSTSDGQSVSFCSAIVIMTSNLGVAEANRKPIRMGKDIINQGRQFIQAVRKAIRPELFNRIDDVLIFDYLGEKEIRSIVLRELEKLDKREGVLGRPIEISYSETALDYLADIGFDAKYGARYLKRVLRNELLIPLAAKLNQFDNEDQLKISVDFKEEALQIDCEDIGDFSYLIDKEIQLSDANLISDLRRSLKRTEQGYALSQLRHLAGGEPEKNIKTLLTSYSSLVKQVESTETNVLQSLLRSPIPDSNLSFTDQVDRLKQEWSKWRTDAASILRPDLGKCRLAVYGKNCKKAILMYHDLLQLLQIEPESEKLLYLDRSGGKEKLKIRDWKKAPAIQAEENEDIELMGAEWHLESPCVQLLLRAEEGLQNWIDEKNRKTVCLVRVQHLQEDRINDFRLNVWRKKFSNRRTINTQRILDNSLRINQEYQKNTLPTIIERKLKEVYETLLDEILQ